MINKHALLAKKWKYFLNHLWQKLWALFRFVAWSGAIVDLVFASFIASHSCDSDPNMQQIKIHRWNKLEMKTLRKKEWKERNLGETNKPKPRWWRALMLIKLPWSGRGGTRKAPRQMQSLHSLSSSQPSTSHSSSMSRRATVSSMAPRFNIGFDLSERDLNNLLDILLCPKHISIKFQRINTQRYGRIEGSHCG